MRATQPIGISPAVNGEPTSTATVLTIRPAKHCRDHPRSAIDIAGSIGSSRIAILDSYEIQRDRLPLLSSRCRMRFAQEARGDGAEHHHVRHAATRHAGQRASSLWTAGRSGMAEDRRRDNQEAAVGGVLLRPRQAGTPLQSHELGVLWKCRLFSAGCVFVRDSGSLQLSAAAQSCQVIRRDHAIESRP